MDILKKWWFWLVIVAVVVLAGVITAGFYLFEYVNDMALCDGISYNFYNVSVYSGNLENDFNSYTRDKTITFKECKVKSYEKAENIYIADILKKYSIEVYNVTFSCGNFDFQDTLYIREGIIYRLFRGLGPCNHENVHFDRKYFNPNQEYIEEEIRSLIR